jgi:putative lipoprotein (rSAM/lipoprotein system)
MKKIGRKFILINNSIITVLLTLLGFGTSCEKIGGGGGGTQSMYGTPSAKFIIKGNVVSLESDEPVRDFKVFITGDTSKTDADGNYTLATGGFPKEQSINISFQDIDSTLNGEFEDLDTTAVFKDPKYINGDGHWYRGETSKELIIKLKTKK